MTSCAGRVSLLHVSVVSEVGVVFSVGNPASAVKSVNKLSAVIKSYLITRRVNLRQRYVLSSKSSNSSR